MTKPLLSVENLSVNFHQQEKVIEAVKSVSFTLNHQETVALVGESGSGKSVTALSILQLLPYPKASHPTGHVYFHGYDLIHASEKHLLSIRGNKIAMIFQEPMTSLNPLHTVQKQIEEVKQSWDKEKMDHDVEVAERNRQEELQRQRNRDEYLYETARERKKAEDEFADRKVIWEKELRDQKEAIENDRRELERLRKLVEDFEVEKEKAVEVAKASVQGQLMANFASEKKLREQEFKAEKDVFNLKINTLSSENARLINEIATLKQRLDEATRQLKEVAVKIIESRGNLSKTSQLEE